MTPGSLTALDVLRRILGRYSDVAPEQVVPEAELSALQVDSLTLAELLFELEDLVGTPMADPAARPTHVRDLLLLIEPHHAAHDERAPRVVQRRRRCVTAGRCGRRFESLMWRFECPVVAV